MLSAEPTGMADSSLEERIAVIEAAMGGKTLQEHFREHAELIDRRFAEVQAQFAAQNKRFDAIDARFVAIDLQFAAVHSRLDAMDERFNRLDHEFSLMRRDIALILNKLTSA